MRVLVLAPHADDETLGLGGTIAKRIDQGHDVTVAVLTGHGGQRHPLYKQSTFETVRNECREAMDVLGVRQLMFRELPTVLVSEQPRWRVNQVVNALVEEVQPQELFVPFPFDMHRDHRELFHAASVAWRPVSAAGRDVERVLAYEVLSETHWNAPYLEPAFVPTVFEDISTTVDRKVGALRKFRSQLREYPDIRSVDAVLALAALRGAQVGVTAAEGFVLIRAIQ